MLWVLPSASHPLDSFWVVLQQSFDEDGRGVDPGQHSVGGQLALIPYIGLGKYCNAQGPFLV